MGLLTDTKEKKTQLLLKDNRHFTIRKLPLEHSCLVEKDGEKIKRAWKHFFGSEFTFTGYKNASADSVTLSFNRDIILDPFNKVRIGENESDKPDNKGKSLIKWLGKISTNMRSIYNSRPEHRTTANALFWLFLGIDCLIFIGWAIKFFTKG
jgi:hypothetical protein